MRNVFGALLLALVLVSNVEAGVVWDWSPDATSGSGPTNWTNQNDQNYQADTFKLASNTALTGVDIYSDATVGFVGDAVIIRIWDDALGSPGTLLWTLNETLSAVDTVETTTLADVTRKHADVTSVVTLASGLTYWISMTGADGVPISQLGLDTNPPGDAMAYWFSPTVALGLQDSGDMSFRLEGDVIPGSAVPEPATLGSAALAGLALAAVARRRRHSA